MEEKVSVSGSVFFWVVKTVSEGDWVDLEAEQQLGLRRKVEQGGRGGFVCVGSEATWQLSKPFWDPILVGR